MLLLRKPNTLVLPEINYAPDLNFKHLVLFSYSIVKLSVHCHNKYERSVNASQWS